MYNHFFNPDIFTISSAIYMLGAMCLVLVIKLIKLEKENRKNVDLIMYLHDRISVLEEENND